MRYVPCSEGGAPGRDHDALTMAQQELLRAPNIRLLFEQAAPSTRSSRIIVLAYGVGFVALSTVSLLRQSGAPATNTIWAEDGAVFYSEALRHSFFGGLFTPYGGYLQLYPRLAFGLLRFLPVGDIAATTAIVGAASFGRAWAVRVPCVPRHHSVGGRAERAGWNHRPLAPRHRGVAQ